CAAHPGPAPLLVEWNEAGDGNGGGAPEPVRLRSRAFHVDAADDLLAALRGVLGSEQVRFVRAG
ncbi:MAG: hypothetical protein ACREMV_06015, partial [Gemmatimonadales bacterium]